MTSNISNLPVNVGLLAKFFSDYFTARITDAEVRPHQFDALISTVEFSGLIGVFKDLWLSEVEKIIQQAKVNEYTKTGLIIDRVWAEMLNDNDPEYPWPQLAVVVAFNTPGKTLKTPIYYVSRLYTFTGTVGEHGSCRFGLEAGIPICTTTNPFTKLIPQQISEVIKLFLPLTDVPEGHLYEMSELGVFTTIEQYSTMIPKVVDQLVFAQINQLKVPVGAAILVSYEDVIANLEQEIDRSSSAAEE